MTSLPTFIKEKEEAFDETFFKANMTVAEALRQSVRPENIKSFLTQAMKDSYALGIERAVGEAKEMSDKTELREDGYCQNCGDHISAHFQKTKQSGCDFERAILKELIAALQKELSSIRDNS